MSWLPPFLRTYDIPPDARSNYRAELSHTLHWVVLVASIEGTLSSIVVSKTFGASRLLTTIVWCVPIVANLLNLVWSAALRGRHRVPAMTRVCIAICVAVASIGLLPSNSGPWGGWVFAGQLACAYALVSGLITLRISLWQANYPTLQRAQIASRIEIITGLAIATIPLALGTLYDHWSGAYRVVYPAAAVIGLLGLRPLQRIVVPREDDELARMRVHVTTPGDTRARRLWRGVRESLAIFRDDRRYRDYLIAQFLLGCGNFGTEPILVNVVSKDMALSYAGAVGILTVARAAVMLATMPFWSRYFDRAGIYRFRVENSTWWVASFACVTAAMGVWGLGGVSGVAWALVIGLILVGRVCNGMGSAGGVVAWPLGHLAFASDHRANLYLGLHVALTGLRGLLMPIVAFVLNAEIGNWSFAVALALGIASNLMYRKLLREELASPAGPAGALAVIAE